MIRGAYGRVLRGLARRAGLRVFRVLSRPLEAVSAPSPLAPRRLREDEVLALCADPQLDLREDAVRAAFARGDLCVAVPDGDTVAGYCWFAFSPLPHLDGVWVEFGSHAAWTYKSLVRPSHRGRGIAPGLYRFADAACRERGRTLSLICVEEHNAPSIAAALRAGFAPSGRAAWVRRSGAVRTWHSDAVTQQGVRFYVPRN